MLRVDAERRALTNHKARQARLIVVAAPTSWPGRPRTRCPPRARPSHTLSAVPILLSDYIDAWLECLTRPSGNSYPARPPRCDNMAEDAGALSDMTPQPAPDPDAQTTVNDFLDYTEFFPSDLVRSLRLIGDLDATCHDATQRVHELTLKYGKLPAIPANERPDPTSLRREIAATLEKALCCRESTFAEASRLYEVAERHCHRIAVIKRKLQALPQPPSRDPTPAPVSPQASRSINRVFGTAHLRFTFDGSRHGAARPRDRRNIARFHTESSSDVSDADSDLRSAADLAITPRKLKQLKDKTPKLPKSRARPPGSGTNVHSSIAGISTSNALAKLSPPPPDAKPGSKWAPWFKLTEYEMAVLRKQMKKNAVWTPSETMIKRQLEAKGRGQANYEQEKARCEATGEEFLDEEPVVPSSKAVPPPAAPEPPPAALLVTVAAPPTPQATSLPVSVEHTQDAAEDVPTDTAKDATKETATKDATNDDAQDDEHMADDDREAVSDVDFDTEQDPRQAVPDKEQQRRQAERDAQDLENISGKISVTGLGLTDITFEMPTTKKTRSSNKRKREATPPAVADMSPGSREPSLTSQDSGTKPPDSKRPRVLPPLAPAPTPGSRPQSLTPVALSPVESTPATGPETTKTTTVQIPLAPAGPTTPTPTAVVKLKLRSTSQHSTPPVLSPTAPSHSELQKSPLAPAPAPLAATVTAASTRSRRESVAPKAASPAPTPVPPANPNAQQASTAVTETPLPPLAQPPRPRSARGHVPTPKAQSEEPKPHEPEKAAREPRRHSIFSQSTLAGAPTRMSTRKKPPPKGDITAGEDGQKTVTNVKRAQGNKNKKKKKADEKADEEPEGEDIDPNEPRYCLCDDVSYGQMISCDNNVGALIIVLGILLI